MVGMRPNCEAEGMNTLFRPRDDRILAGVCSGLAHRFGAEPRTVRLLFLLSCLIPGPQAFLYLLLWIIIPGERRTTI